MKRVHTENPRSAPGGQGGASGIRDARMAGSEDATLPRGSK